MWTNLKQYHGNCLKELKKIRIVPPNKSQKPYSLIQIFRFVFGVEITIHKQIMEFVMLQVSLGRILVDTEPMKYCKSVSRSFLNLLDPELFFLVLAHLVHKMRIIREPNTIELWNKLHFEEEKTEIIRHV